LWHEYIQPDSLDGVLTSLADRRDRARVVAGATDLMLELERGVRTGVDTLIDVSRIEGLDRIEVAADGAVHLGPLVTHNDCCASSTIRTHAYPLARAAWEVGAPQIRNRATVAGNLITASPANDTITPLVALGASVTLASARGQRTVPLHEFYTGVRRTVMAADEMLIDICVPPVPATGKGTFVKIALRRAQAISIVNVAIVLDFEVDVVRSAAITLGAVAPTIIHAPLAEQSLKGRVLDDSIVAEAANLAMAAAADPRHTDARWSAWRLPEACALSWPHKSARDSRRPRYCFRLLPRRRRRISLQRIHPAHQSGPR
jgi:CO/xanthine dehydrogenase FAD-binding subunit